MSEAGEPVVDPPSPTLRPGWSKNGGTFKPPEELKGDPNPKSAQASKKGNAFDMLDSDDEGKDVNLGGAGTTSSSPTRGGGGGRSLADLAAKSPPTNPKKGKEVPPAEPLDGGR